MYKTFTGFFTVLAAIFSLVCRSQAQWTQTGGPPSEITALGVNGSDIFAGTIYGAYISTDNGSNWTAINNGLGIPPNSMQVNSFAFSGGSIFAGMNGGVYLSTNNGSNWWSVSSGLNYATVNALALNGSDLFAGTVSNGLYISTDNGTSWTAVNSGLTSTSVYSLTIFAGKLLAGTNYRFYNSCPLSSSFHTALCRGVPSAQVI